MKLNPPTLLGRALVALALAVSCFVTPGRTASFFNESDGIVIFEAEDFTTNISPRAAHSWVLSNTVTGASGTGYMEATPNNGTNLNVDWLGVSPELQYPVNFSNAAAHYVWVRAFAYTNTDDSIHAGLDNTTNSASAITLVSTNAWAWTTNRTGLARPTVTGAVGPHTFSLWMREDGMRVDRVLLTTNANLLAQTGNAWHIPNNPEPAVGLAAMRLPTTGIYSNNPVIIINGNQFQGTGNAANQASLSSFIYYKRATDTNWTSLPMTFLATGGNNKYFSNAIPAGTFSAGDVVQYYLRIGYTDRLPTYLYGNDALSRSSELESDAQADPYSFDIQSPLQPSGGYLTVSSNSTSGTLEARIYTNSGHLAIAGPDLVGNPLANVVTFTPPIVKAGGELHNVGRVLSSTVITNGLQLTQQVGPATVTAQLTFKTDGVMRYEVTDWGGLVVDEVQVQSASDSSEHFYGLGEKFNDFDQANKLVHIMTYDRPGDKQDYSYKVAPWFVSTRGYGFHLDSSAESWFDLRAANADRIVVSNLFSSLKFNVAYGPQLTNVLARYTGYAGRPPAPPAWAFAPWMSSDIWHNGGEVRYVISKYRALGIPGSVFVFDSPWEVGYNDFTWNMTQFATNGVYEGTNYHGFTSVTDMMTFLRTNGFKVICWMTPFVNTTGVNDGVGGQNLGQAANYAAGSNNNYFVRSSAGGPPLVVNWWKGTGSPIDFTNPNARDWITAQLSNLVAQSGNVIGGFKTDDGESASADGNVYIPTNAVYYDGRTGIEMRNGLATEYHKTIWNVLGTNGLLFARSGFVGSQAYPAGWAGDNEPNFGSNGLSGVVIAGQSAAMSGISLWSHDVGGYQDSNWSSTPTNLFVRWTQFGALTPIMQMHRQVAMNRQYPWSYGDEGLTNYLYYTRLHTALFPYLQAYAAQTATTGLPLIRPLVLLNQTDANTYGLRQTYLLGNELLYAAIITNNAITRSVYLPAGNWYDFFTQQKFTGSQNITWSNANQWQAPIFVREGAIIPLTPTNVQTLCDAAYVANPALKTWDGSLEFLVYPSAISSFTLADGATAQCTTNGTVTTLSLTSTARAVTFRVLATAPFSVERDGITLPKFTNAVDFANATTGWYYAAPFVQVKFPHSGGTTQLKFAPDSLGDGISDSWRQNYFNTSTTNATTCATCDADGDGFSNLQEYLAGTNPTDNTSRLRITSLDPVARILSWSSVSGRTYQVEATTNLTFVFSPLSSLLTATGATSSYFDSLATPSKYYRVKLGQ